ncbi:MAG: lysophospholipase [Leptospiraceae bacterium]|nr:lysophospholipase [Leptospiraceae bacterium]MCP5495983.1 lysophospholipase [Leptospiraceae bacterium]
MSFTNHHSSFKSSKDGMNIFYQFWTKPYAKRFLVIQHGFSDHSDRYENLVNHLQDSDINIYALDSRGHGRSDGIRGHVDEFSDYASDLGDLINIVKKEEKTEKVFLLGHSMGGVIVLQYTLEPQNQKNLHALITSAPALRVKMSLDKEIKKTVAGFLANIFPSFIIDADLNTNYLSHDKAVVEKYNSDPLVHGKVSFKMGTTLFNIADVIYKKLSNIQIPIFITHGEADGIIDVEGSKELFYKLTAQNKTLKVYPGLYHETMNEIPEKRETVLKDIGNFIDSIQAPFPRN